MGRVALLIVVVLGLAVGCSDLEESKPPATANEERKPPASAAEESKPRASTDEDSNDSGGSSAERTRDRSMSQHGPGCVPETMAHRGYWEVRTENTLGAFQAAVDGEAHWFEADVRWSRTDAMVVMHDERLERTTTGTGRVSRRGGPYIRRHRANDGQRVPWVTEALRLARNSDVSVALDIKPRLNRQRAEQLIGAVYRLGMAERVMLLTSRPSTVALIEQLAPDLATARLSPEPGWYALAGSDYLFAPLAWTNAETVAAAHANGVKVVAPAKYWAPRPEVWVRLVEAGVDIVISDDAPQQAAFYQDLGASCG